MAAVATDSDEQLAAASGSIDRGLLAIASVVVLGMMMAILDTTVVNVAVNTLAGRFQATLPAIQWVVTGYMLALATVIPLSGWISDRFGTKRLYMASIALFVVGSALCGAADGTAELVLFRVLQGLGGGMLMPVGMTILTRAAGPRRLGRVMSVVGVPMLIGPILGPVLGGWLVSDASWRWIFFINAPLGVVALLAAYRILPRDVGRREQRLDYVDLLLASPGVTLLIFGLAQSDSGGFGRANVVVPILAGLVLLTAFVLHALRTANPLVDLRLFGNRAFATSSLAMVLMEASVFGSLLLLPLYFQQARGASPLSSGLLMIPQGVGELMMVPLSGVLVDRWGLGRVAPFGIATMGATVLWLTGLGAHTAYWELELDLVINGLGMGLVMLPVFTGAVRTIRAAQAASASALLNVMQQIGTSTGTAALTVLLASAMRTKLGAVIGANPSTKLSTLGLAGFPAHVRPELARAAAAAFASTFWWALGLIALALLVSPLLPRNRLEASGVEPLSDEQDGVIELEPR
ncbi:MAG: DHA2 family efflux MFS transporter permease subunit [Terriglobales bacterium]